ncbi:integrase arm-type DNA-binding domain-containing protein [Hyphobacterium sp. HN65]|uniref:Integrase arm-type DNA-binding domain-containing protein n=1 Tax=Hyphobacterium lacteum TaxID=3116575 RepID=A0ABU7LT39_9PROT|nr:integrase arm-type DNA-binding domain-containing protein [Hyphobacterium sp. HN65]MEE2526499.1 integrase arm-type DNA-binding domain-containing protein [Hyphobacterium sp. HN65]
MKLTDRTIKALRPKDHAYKKADGKGLTLLVNADGGKHWRFRYRFHGREKMLSLGSFPDVSLSLARQKRDEMRRVLALGLDPSVERKKERLRAAFASSDTFEQMASAYIAKRQAEGAAPRTLKKQKTFLGALRADIGAIPISALTSEQLLAALQKHETRGKRTLANEARAFASRVLQLAIAQGRASRNVADDLRGALIAPLPGGHAAITCPKELGRLLACIRAYEGETVTSLCLEILAHVFVRPSELREARWDEFDLEKGLWRIPAIRTKLRREHIVPLSPQVIRLLKELRRHTGNQAFIAASSVKPDQPISDMTFNKALRSLGFDRRHHVAHGFRRTASTLLNEQGYNRDWIERQLAHVERNKVRGAYNAAEYLDGRRRMMCEWSSYLGELLDEAQKAKRKQ